MKHIVRVPVRALVTTLLIHLRTPGTAPELVPGRSPPFPQPPLPFPWGHWPPHPTSLSLDPPGSQCALGLLRKPLPFPGLEFCPYPLQTLRLFQSNVVAVQMRPVSSK